MRFYVYTSRSTTLLALAFLFPQPVLAQSAIEGRVGRLESEMRAVQRKVFPGGAGQSFEPQITPGQQAAAIPGTPASSAVDDLAARVSSLEQQLSSMTGQIETTQHRVQLIEDGLAAYQRATDARLKALEGAAVPAQAAEAALPPAGGATARPPVLAAPATTAARAKLVAAVEKPDTDNAAEDAYTYGFRLWQAKLYPEAEAQFKSVVATYPKHSRASYAQNMLGRSYLDEGKPSLASIAFYDNYKKMPDGDRAPDSLYFLGQALIKLKKPADACKVYSELSDVYAAKITPELKAKIAAGRSEAKCS